MSESSNPQVALLKGIYRCTRLGETHFSEIGELLPACSCEGGGSWLFFKDDNIAEKDTIVVFVGSGIIHAIVMDEIPEPGYELNIRQSMNGCGIETGKYRVVRFEDNFTWKEAIYFRVWVERIGDPDDTLPVHQALTMTC